MNDFNHAIDWDKTEVILYCHNVIRRNIVESAMIRYKENLVNPALVPWGG